MSDKLIEQIQRHEGFRSKPYLDSLGYTTIGYGRCLDKRGVSRQEAYNMLITDITEARRDVFAAIGTAVHLDEVRLNVLVNMSFNLGIAGLLKFKKMLIALDAGDYKTASHEMIDSKWHIQVGRRAIELEKQMLTGEYN